MLKSLFAVLATIGGLSFQSRPVETLRSVAALPAHVAGRFEEIAACHITPEGDYIVFDRRSHAVSRISADGAALSEVVQIGVEPGRILLPIAFDSAPDGTFVVADAPGGVERIQLFLDSGSRIGGFSLPGRSAPRVTLGNSIVLNGVGSLDYTGKTILVSDPASGALISEYGLDGTVLRTFGALRRTGHEEDRELHLALNSGYPLSLRDGGFYFVFIAGVPMFRKYDAKGVLLYERHIEGPEIDDYLRTLPSVWPRRKTASGEFPIVTTAVRTASVGPDDSLWISLVPPLTYVYDGRGEKRRTVEFRAAGVLSPADLFFAPSGRLIAAPGCYAFDVK
jgi:hypothetical protein